MHGWLERAGLAKPLAVLFPPRNAGRADTRLTDGRWPSRYESLDHLRGLAAIGIVLHHAAFIDFNLGTGRVLLFFVISGYCIAASAASCARRGMSPSRFLVRRVHRIYPPYLLAILFWTGTRLVKLYRTGENDLVQRFATLPDGTREPRTVLDWIQNLTLTQWVTMLWDPISHPGANKVLFVAAFWSLCYEEQFYLVMAGLFALTLAVPRLRIWPMMLGLAVLAIGWGMLHPVNVHGIFLEYWISFTVGATAFYRLSVVKDRRRRWLVDLAMAVFAAAAYIGLQYDPRVPEDAERSKWIEWLLAAAFYALLIVLRPVDRHIAGFWLLVPLRAVGRITYSLYLIHQFNLSLIYSATTALIRLVDRGYQPPANPAERPWFDVTIQVLLHIGLATVFWLFCEYPFLNKDADAGGGKPGRDGGEGGGGGCGENRCDGLRPGTDQDGARPAHAPREAGASRDG